MKNKVRCLIILLFVLSIVLFVYSFVFLKPIEILTDPDVREDTEKVEIDYLNDIGLENKELIEEKYNGNIFLDNIWVDFKLIFGGYKDEFIEKYSNLNIPDSDEEKINLWNEYKNTIYERYGINTDEEINMLYNTLKNKEVERIIVKEGSVLNVENGTSFEIEAIDKNNEKVLFTCLIYNDYLEGTKIYLKLLPKAE